MLLSTLFARVLCRSRSFRTAREKSRPERQPVTHKKTGGGGRMRPGISRAPGRLKSAAAFAAIVTGYPASWVRAPQSSKPLAPPSARHTTARSKRQTPRTLQRRHTKRGTVPKTNVREKLLPVASPPRHGRALNRRIQRFAFERQHDRNALDDR